MLEYDSLVELGYLYLTEGNRFQMALMPSEYESISNRDVLLGDLFAKLLSD